MIFSSLEFIFVFLPVFCITYLLLPWKLKNLGLLLISLAFYGYGVKEKPFSFFLLLMAVVITYLSGRFMGRCKNRAIEKRWLILGLVYNFGWMLLFKYTGFLLNSINGILMFFGSSMTLPETDFVLPPGISFYTFQMTAYLLDIYYRRVQAEKSPLMFGTYAFMFPQLLSGPIVTYAQIKDRLELRRHSLQKLDEGLRLFTIGLGMKVILANRLSGLWNGLHGIGYESISTPLAWMGIFGFSLQIYFDFYGYTLMAVGLAHMMGFSLPINFRHPYMSTSMTDFWRRWHITLGSWFREYVYIPLGGNRRGFFCQVRNMFVVWLLTGLWHGASWNFILWGIVLFLILVVEKAGLLKLLDKFRPLGHIYMLFLIPLTWTIFAITDFSQLRIYLLRLFPFFGGQTTTVFAGDFLKYGKTYGIWLILGLLFCTGLPKRCYTILRNKFLMAPFLLLIFWYSVYCLYSGMNDPFLYFSF